MDWMEILNFGTAIVALILGGLALILPKIAPLTPWKWDDDLAAFVEGVAKHLGKDPKELIEDGYDTLVNKLAEDDKVKDK